MNGPDFRRSALALPEATESAHMDHPDFRVRGKIFATLSGADESMGMVKLTPDQQAAFVREAPLVFHPASGAWGRSGCTMVRLAAASESSVRRAIAAAWRNAAPKRLSQQHPAE